MEEAHTEPQGLITSSAPTLIYGGRGMDGIEYIWFRVWTASFRCSKFAFSTLREQQGDMRGKLRCPPTLRRLLKLRKVNPCLTGGWQQPLNHHKAQPARRVKDAEGTAKPLVLDSARWLGYLQVNIATSFTFRRKSHFENYGSKLFIGVSK